MAVKQGPGYFIMLRYSSGYMVPVDEGEGDGVALFDTEEQAQDWIDSSMACRSGQVLAEIHEAP